MADDRPADIGADLETALAVVRSSGCKPALVPLMHLSSVGNAAAQYQLAQCFYFGSGVPHDPVRARSLFEAAAEQNMMFAQQNLAAMYQNGEGGAEDGKVALYWFHRAAEQGDAFAKLSLGRRYISGDQSERDVSRAKYLLVDAAKQGLPEAEYALSMFYAQGLDGTQDFRSALVWSQRAADQGYAPAAFNVATAYHNGQGVPKNLAKSYLWLLISAKLPKPDSSGRINGMIQGFEKTLSPAIAATARQDAADWLSIRDFNNTPMWPKH